MKIQLLLMSFLFLGISCSKRNKIITDGCKTIYLTNYTTNIKELIDTITYIKLDTKSVLGEISKIVIYKNK